MITIFITPEFSLTNLNFICVQEDERIAAELALKEEKAKEKKAAKKGKKKK